MSLRGRIALLAAGAVALAVAVSTLVAYFATGSILRGEIDERLSVRANMVEQPAAGVMFTAALPPTIPIVFDRLVEVDSILQVIDPSGQVMVSMIGVGPLPVEAIDLTVAQGGVRALRTVNLADERFRMVTAPMAGGGAVQIAMSLTEAEGTLTGLRLVLLGVGLIGVLVAAWIGWLIANRALRPIDDLTNAAETIASTHELSTRIPEPGRDEIGRLAGSFNRMLDVLEDSWSRQHQLVTDGYEFRTPLTSLLTNVETLSCMTTPSLRRSERGCSTTSPSNSGAFLRWPKSWSTSRPTPRAGPVMLKVFDWRRSPLRSLDESAAGPVARSTSTWSPTGVRSQAVRRAIPTWSRGRFAI